MRWAHVLGAVLALQAGCSTAGMAWTEKDAWYHPIDVDAFEGWQDVAFTPVTAARRDEAIALLDQAPAVPIDAGMAKHLTDGAWTLDEPAYAVRAVFLNEATGGFSVQAKDHMLWVQHGSLGHHAVPMKRAVLVVGLPEAPRTVYVTCDMAE